MMDTSNNNSPASPGRDGGGSGGGGGLDDDTTPTVNVQPGRRGGQVGERVAPKVALRACIQDRMIRFTRIVLS